ncbi:DUF563 domain-containing protein [Epidermidibacterium keratini]|uniref:DUF563 domain-containing protein n=1 Tax=Epidermidibacterium keratini TaxID=1891644 RepID=A0A7L4YQZ4_9ACTN|nr:glycosyltransferase family 61 protein [Epidermidibacterium keratini]QHC01482.1 DUF563 domain-containing protein [Epidermidibacterium keratini]
MATPTVDLTIGTLDTPSAWRRYRVDQALVNVRVHAELSIDEPETTPASWDDLLSRYRIGGVLDHQGDSAAAHRFAVLWPALEPGGRYLFPATAQAGAATIEDFLVTELRGQASELSAYVKRTVDSFESGERFHVLVKAPFAQWRMRATTISTATADALQLLPATFYRRTVPTLYGQPAKSEFLDAATCGFAPQAVDAQYLAVLGECLVTGYGNVHPTDDTVLDESFAHSRHSNSRGLFYRSADTSWFSSVMDLAHRPDAVVDEPCLVMKQTWDANYGHWLIDSFARLAAAREVLPLPQMQVLVNLVPSPAMTEVITAALSLLEVDAAQIRVQSTPPIRLRDAYYPGPVSQAPLIKHPAAIEFLRSLADRARELGGTNHAPGGRIYLSRNSTGRRRLLNEDDIVEAAADLGYVRLQPEAMSLIDQICTFATATHVVGNMGASFSNLAFSPPGVSVLCLATPAMRHDYFYDLACLNGGRYVGLDGTATGEVNINSDFGVDREQFRRVMLTHDFD